MGAPLALKAGPGGVRARRRDAAGCARHTKDQMKSRTGVREARQCTGGRSQIRPRSSAHSCCPAPRLDPFGPLVIRASPGGVSPAQPGNVASAVPWNLAYIPSPSTGVVHLGPIPLRGYAFCIIIGVFVAVWLGEQALGRPRRQRRHGRRHRRMGGAVRAGRRAALPRHHRLRAVLRRRPATGSTPSRSGTAASASGAPSRSARSAPGSAAAAAGSRCRPSPTPAPRPRPRPGHRPLGQLVQPGAVRQADRRCPGR